MPNPCIFCGTTAKKITKEHVWSEWTKGYLKPDPGQMAHAESWSSKSGARRWREPLLESQVRVVCHDCNTRWMSRIDKRAAPIVGPMLIGQATALDAAAQQIVANWAVLKGLVVAQISPKDRWIPPDHYDRVHAAQGAPADTVRVWLARRHNLLNRNDPLRAKMANGHVIPLKNIFRGLFLPTEMRRYLEGEGELFATSLQLGHFVTLTVHHDWPGMEVRSIPTSAGPLSFLPIWPAGPSVRWPPLMPVDGLGDPQRITQFFMMAPPGTPVPVR